MVVGKGEGFGVPKAAGSAVAGVGKRTKEFAAAESRAASPTSPPFLSVMAGN